MDRSSFTSSFKKYGTVAICLVFFLIVEIVTIGIFNTLLPGNPTTMNIYSKYQLAKTPDRPIDILILGDSSCGSAISAGQLGQELNKKAVALHTPSRTTLMGNYFILEEYMKVNEPPEAVLMMFVYDVWPRKLSDWAVIQVINFNFREKIGSLLKSPKLEGYQEFVEGTVKFLQPSRRYKWEYERLIETGIPISEYRQIKEDYLVRRMNTVYNPKPDEEDIEEEAFVRPKKIELDLQLQLRKTRASEFEVSRLNRIYLEKIIELCQERGTEVYFIPHVIHTDYYHDPDGRFRLQAIKNFLMNYEVDYSNFKVLIGYLVVPPEGLSNSIDHANRDVRIMLTGIIAEELRK